MLSIQSTNIHSVPNVIAVIISDIMVIIERNRSNSHSLFFAASNIRVNNPVVNNDKNIILIMIIPITQQKFNK